MRKPMVGQFRAIAFGTLMACFLVCLSMPFMSFGDAGRRVLFVTSLLGALALLLLLATRPSRRD
jgi:hypothetical protein